MRIIIYPQLVTPLTNSIVVPNPKRWKYLLNCIYIYIHIYISWPTKARNIAVIKTKIQSCCTRETPQHFLRGIVAQKEGCHSKMVKWLKFWNSKQWSGEKRFALRSNIKLSNTSSITTAFVLMPLTFMMHTWEREGKEEEKGWSYEG